jgi:hypothetical protein
VPVSITGDAFFRRKIEMIWRGQLRERKRVVAAMASQGKCRAEISARLTNGHEQRENAEQNPVNVESVAEPRMDPGKAWVFKHEKAECDSEKKPVTRCRPARTAFALIWIEWIPGEHVEA